MAGQQKTGAWAWGNGWKIDCGEGLDCGLIHLETLTADASCSIPLHSL